MKRGPFWDINHFYIFEYQRWYLQVYQMYSKLGTLLNTWGGTNSNQDYSKVSNKVGTSVDTKLVPNPYQIGTKVQYQICIKSILNQSLVGTSLVPPNSITANQNWYLWWYLRGTKLVPNLFSDLYQICTKSVPNLVRIWFETWYKVSTKSVQIPFYIGTTIEPIWYQSKLRHCIKMVPIRYQSDTSLVPILITQLYKHWYKLSINLVPNWYQFCTNLEYHLNTNLVPLWYTLTYQIHSNFRIACHT